MAVGKLRRVPTFIRGRSHVCSPHRRHGSLDGPSLSRSDRGIPSERSPPPRAHAARGGPALRGAVQALRTGRVRTRRTSRLAGAILGAGCPVRHPGRPAAARSAGPSLPRGPNGRGSGPVAPGAPSRRRVPIDGRAGGKRCRPAGSAPRRQHLPPLCGRTSPGPPDPAVAGRSAPASGAGPPGAGTARDFVVTFHRSPGTIPTWTNVCASGHLPSLGGRRAAGLGGSGRSRWPSR
jgi:hypothetical protein